MRKKWQKRLMVAILGTAVFIQTPAAYVQASQQDDAIAENRGAIAPMAAGSVDADGFNEDGFKIVNGILYAYKGNQTEVVIPDGVKEISFDVFAESSVTKITIPSSVTLIQECMNMDEWTEYALFPRCYNLETIEVLPGNSRYSSYEGCLYNQDGSKLLRCPSGRGEVKLREDVTSIDTNAFLRCSKLVSVDIPVGVTDFGYDLFPGCTALVSVEVAEENSKYSSYEGCLYSKDGAALRFCPGGKENLSVREGVTQITESAFSQCVNLVTVTLPESLQKMEDSFSNCDKLEKIEVAAGNVTYTSKDGCLYANGGTMLLVCPGTKTDLVVPDGVESIDRYAFSRNSKLIHITIPQTINDVDGIRYWSCANLESVEVSNGNSYYSSYDGCLYSVDGSELIFCPRGIKNITISGKADAFDLKLFQDCDFLECVEVMGGNSTYSSYDGCLYNQDGTQLLFCPQRKGTVAFGDNVGSMDSKAFKYCQALENVEISGENSVYSSYDGCLYTKDGRELLYCPLKKTHVEVKDGVTAIREDMFSKCRDLASISLPNSITSIEDSAFENCSSLTELHLPSGITSIGEQAFSGCSNLTGIELPSGITSISAYMFWDCVKLDGIQIPEKVTDIGEFAFSGCINLSGIRLPQGVTGIDWMAFGNCQRLSSIQIPETVTYIGSSAFSNCHQLSSIRLPKGLTCIESSVFEYCANLKEINIPENIATIESYAFEGCSSLESIVLPAGVKTIESSAFEGCSGLKSIVLPGSVTSMEDNVFDDCPGLTIYGPAGSYAQTYAKEKGIPFVETTEQPQPEKPENPEKPEKPENSSPGDGQNQPQKPADPNTPGTGGDKQPVVQEPNNPSKDGGKTFPAKGTKLTDNKKKTAYKVTKAGSTVSFAGLTNKKATSAKVPSTVKLDGVTYKVTAIENNAFKNNKKLQQVTISGNVASIGSSAFYNCTALKKITVPAKVAKIGSKAFYNCKKLTSITIKSKKLSSSKIGSKAFTKVGSGNYKRVKVTVPSSKYKAYKKALQKKGLSKYAKVVKK